MLFLFEVYDDVLFFDAILFIYRECTQRQSPITSDVSKWTVFSCATVYFDTNAEFTI